MGQSISLGPQGCNQPAAFHLTEALPSPGSQVSPAGSFLLSHARFWFLTHTLVCLTDILTAKSCALHLHPRAAIRGHWPCWAKEHWEVLISAAPLITAAPLSHSLALLQRTGPLVPSSSASPSYVVIGSLSALFFLSLNFKDLFVCFI